MHEAQLLMYLGTLASFSREPLIDAVLRAEETMEVRTPTFTPVLAALLTNREVGGAMTTENGFSPFVEGIIRIGDQNRKFGEALTFAASVVEKAEVLKLAGVDPDQIGVVNFFRILGWAISNGCPLLEALEIAGKGGLPEGMATFIAVRVTQGGKTLATALRDFPKVFTNPHIFSSMSLAEETGSIPAASEQLANLHECKLLAHAGRLKIEEIFRDVPA
jgi:type II secretory pathway component PulF